VRTRRLRRDFYDRATLTVTRELIGKVLVHETPAGRTSGVIVETEAYIGEDDPACHAAPGPTRRNRPLYGPPGFSYVYLNYGIHFLTNVVTEREGAPAAVLLRALEPLDGITLMRTRRSRIGADPNAAATHDLCRGPGNLSRAMGISLSENWLDLQGDRLFIEDRGRQPREIAWGPRIGITVGTEHAWRCFVVGNRAVSGSRGR
jgi:DNA-3-methyladenine glycosylase